MTHPNPACMRNGPLVRDLAMPTPLVLNQCTVPHCLLISKVGYGVTTVLRPQKADICTSGT